MPLPRRSWDTETEEEGEGGGGGVLRGIFRRANVDVWDRAPKSLWIILKTREEWPSRQRWWCNEQQCEHTPKCDNVSENLAHWGRKCFCSTKRLFKRSRHQAFSSLVPLIYMKNLNQQLDWKFNWVLIVISHMVECVIRKMLQLFGSKWNFEAVLRDILHTRLLYSHIIMIQVS